MENDHELTPEQQARVDEIRIALEQELRDNKPAIKTPLVDITELKEDALSALQHVLKHGQNEPLKAKVAMWAYDRMLDAGKDPQDPAAIFFAELAAKGAESQ